MTTIEEMARELYQLYPKHEGKKAAIREIEKTLRGLKGELSKEGLEVTDEVEWIKKRVILYARSREGQDKDFTPHPSTWFHQGRYLDDEKEWFRNGTDWRNNKVRRAQQVANTNLQAAAAVGWVTPDCGAVEIKGTDSRRDQAVGDQVKRLSAGRG